MPNERIGYTVTEAARALGCSEMSLYRKIYRGKIPIVRFAGRIYVPASAFRAFVAPQAQS